MIKKIAKWVEDKSLWLMLLVVAILAFGCGFFACQKFDKKHVNFILPIYSQTLRACHVPGSALSSSQTLSY
jgi:hypothetical protein